MGYAKKVDVNQKDIVATLRKCGMTVRVASMVGHGFPDLVASFRGQTYLIEIKDGDKPPSAQKLTIPEQEFIASWQAPVYIIKSVDEALNFFQSLIVTKQ